jgi:hypothetical protein
LTNYQLIVYSSRRISKATGFPKELKIFEERTVEETPLVRSPRANLGSSQISANKKGEQHSPALLSNTILYLLFIMTQVYEVQTISAFGIPYTESRIAPDPTEIEIVTIEFIPDPDNRSDYGYSHPRYTFTETVALRADWEQCQQHKLDWRDELTFYRVCSLQLVELFSKATGRLTEAPTWLFGVRSYYWDLNKKIKINRL